MNKIKLSVVIPAYNEEKNVAAGVLDQVYEYLKGVNFGYEVIIVDDGSSDHSNELIEKQIRNKPNFILLKNSHKGKAITVMTGILKASGEITVFTDMDQATPIKEIEKFFPKFDEGFDIVIGSRQGRQGAPLTRKFVAWGFSTLRNMILGLPFKDTQCGFKAFNQKAIKSVFPLLMEKWQNRKAFGGAVNAGFDIEALFVGKKKELKIAEVSVAWSYVDTERVQVIGDAIEALKDMFRIRLNDFKGKYS